MKFVLVYVSPNGTTRKTAELLKNIIEREHSVELLDIGRKPYRDQFEIVYGKLKEADVVGFGSPAYHLDVLEPLSRFFQSILAGGFSYSMKAFLFVNYGGISTGKAFLNSAGQLSKAGIPVIGALKVTAPHFHLIKTFPDESVQPLCKGFYERLKDKNFNEIPRQRLAGTFKPLKARVRLIYHFVHMIGKSREMPIDINPEKCGKCGKCENECPAGAIHVQDTAVIDFSRCLHCYHCVQACTFGAVESPIREKLDGMIRMNKKVLGTENPPNGFIV